MDKGETKPQLFECNDGKQYVVKFMTNPVGKKALVHEYIANELAKYLGLPVAAGQVIHFSRELITDTPEIQEFNVEPGPHFGCLYYNNIVRPTNEERIKKCRNLKQMPGVIVFDHWIRNRDRADNLWNLVIEEGKMYNKLYMIDHAGCFFSSIRSSKLLKSTANYMEDVFWGEMYEQFKPFLTKKRHFYRYIKAIENFPEETIKKIVYSTPVEWEPDKDELDGIIYYLTIRKSRVNEPIKRLMKEYL